MAAKAGRNLATQLKLIITAWTMSQFDTYAPAASAANISFNEVFPNQKGNEALVFCRTELTKVRAFLSLRVASFLLKW